MSRKKRVSHKLVHGVGHNDHTYMAKQEDGTYAKSYRLWVKMLARCYSQKIHKDFPSYIACEVSENPHVKNLNSLFLVVVGKSPR